MRMTRHACFARRVMGRRGALAAYIASSSARERNSLSTGDVFDLL